MTDNSAPHMISDEQLMRFVDGDLSPHEQSTIGLEAARDPDVAARIEAFRFTKEEFARAFAPALEVTPSLEGKLRAVGLVRTPSGASLRFVGRSAAQPSRLRRQFMAMAAGVALLLAGAAGWLLRDGLSRDYAGLIAPPSLQWALDETRSGESAKLAGDVTIQVNSTFVSRQFCREYAVLHANGTEAPALACRGVDGSWRVEVREDPSASVQRPADPKKYGIASGETRERGSVAELRDRILSTDVSRHDEENLISGRGERKP
jgi:surface antigen